MIRWALIRMWAYMLLCPLPYLATLFMGYMYKPAIRWDGARWRTTSRAHVRYRGVSIRPMRGGA